MGTAVPMTLAGQGWPQIGGLALAFMLTALVGLERELRAKSAGLRTHTLVGLGAALFMLISKFGFEDLVGHPSVSFDPSRVAAQIVTGIGFIGGGLIFVRRDAVRGLTTAATIWLSAAIGAAAAAGLPALAVLATGGHFAVVYGLAALGRRLPRSASAPSQIRLSYHDQTGVLRHALVVAGRQGFSVAETSVEHSHAQGLVVVSLEVICKGAVAPLVAELAELPGMMHVTAGDANEPAE